jgi:hypothetical protein
VLFVGAGLSQGAGLLGWVGLLNRILSWYDENGVRLADLADIQRLIEEKDLLPAAEAIKDGVNPELFRRALSSIMDDESISPSPTHLLLPTIPFAAVLTSNYDRLLERAYGKVAQLPWVITHNSGTALTAALHDRRFYILKVHGTIEHVETIVLGRRSYRELMHGNEAYVEHIRTLLRTKTLLFVGFSLSDPDLRLILEQEQAVWGGHANIHYALMNAGELNSLVQREWERDYGIQILPYEPSNEYHPEVGEFLKELARQVVASEEGATTQVSHSEAGAAEPPTDGVSLPDSETETEVPAGQTQIGEAVQALTKTLGTESFMRDGRLPEHVDDFQLLRLQLFTATWLVDSVPSSMLGTHEANRLYLYRERLMPTGREFTELLRMLVDEALDYVPGWFWFQGFEAGVVETVIIHLALTDAHSSVRYSAFNLLAKAKVPLPDGYEERLSRAVTSDGSPEVRRAAVSYLGVVGEESHLPAIGSALVDKEARVRYDAKESKLLVLARTDPERAAEELLTETGVEARSILSELLPRAAEIQPETLRKAREHADRDVRLFAVNELVRRGELTTDDANALLQDKDAAVKAAAYRFLIERGTEFDPEKFVLDLPDDSFTKHMSRKMIVRPSPWFDKNEILMAFFRRYDFDQLLELTDWNNMANRAAYRTLAVEHFPRFAEQLRADLRNEFAEAAEACYRKQLAYWEENLRTEDDNSKRRETMPRWEDLSSYGGLFGAFRPSQTERPKVTPESMARSHVEYIKTDLITAALAGLAEYGVESDIVFGRQYLYREDYDLRLEAVRIVSRFGGSGDASDLTKIAKSSDGVLQEFAARGAVRVSGFDPDVIKTLVETRDEALVSVAVSELIGYDDRDAASALLEPFLYDENAGVRMKVTAFFISRFTREELGQLLSRYSSAGTYYYDVVCGLDGALYAPASVVQYVRSEVVGELQRCMWTRLGYGV